MIPYSEQPFVSFLYRNARVLEEEYREQGTYIKAEVDEEAHNKCKKSA
jgi:GTP-binding protein HflX